MNRMPYAVYCVNWRKEMKQWLVLLFLVTFVVGCGKNNVKPTPPKNAYPVSHEVTEVESSNSAETLLRATGQGSTVDYAIADAKKAAIWYLLHAGTKPLLKTSDEKRTISRFDEKLYNDPGVYIRHTSALKSKKKSGKTTIVELIVKVDVAMLTDYLVTNEVIKGVEDVAEGQGLPAISIVAAENSEDAAIAKNTIGEYLSDKDYEVNVVDQSGKLSKIVGKLARLGGNTDPAYAWALEVGSDVFIEVKVNKESGRVSGVKTRKASVTAKAFETSTARQLGSTTGHSSERAASGHDALIQEAANATADKLISQIRKKWLKEAKKGKWFKVVAFTNASGAADTDRALYKALNALPSAKVKRLAAGKTTFQYQIRVNDIGNAFELLDSLSGKYSGAGKLTRELESGSLLVIKAGAGDIDIDFD